MRYRWARHLKWMSHYGELQLEASGPIQSMAAFVAMLRGVNVSGHNTIKMEDLRELCQNLGLRNAQTYIQSGNVVFQTAREDPAALSKRIGETLLQSFGCNPH